MVQAQSDGARRNMTTQTIKGQTSEHTMKTIEQNFTDWESYTFGFGYGTGEEHTLAALKTFFSLVETDDPSGRYDHRKLESALGPTVAWLLINVLCNASVLDYGTSPRFGWLSPEGEKLREFFAAHTIDELYDICTYHDENYIHCGPDYCNCGPEGFLKGIKCPNPFWRSDR